MLVSTEEATTVNSAIPSNIDSKIRSFAFIVLKAAGILNIFLKQQYLRI
jgi:hypothetical protein